jgi:hypothetical protein
MSNRGRTLSCVAATALIAVGALVAGCGGDDDEDAIGKSEFIAKADAICKKGDKEIETTANEVFGGQQEQPSQAQIADFGAETVVPNIEQQIADIRDLGAPAGDEDQVDAILTAAEEATDEVKDDPQLLAGQGDPYAEANRLAKAYGLKECGS